MTPDQDTITIHHFRARYRLAADHPDPDRVKAHLDEVVRKQLPAAIAEALSPSTRRGDEALWLIRGLDVRLDLGLNEGLQTGPDGAAAWDANRLARRWAAAITRALAPILSEGRRDRKVLHFADTATYLGRFLVDLVHDRAWEKWYYRRFDGLRALPASAALRTAICDDARLGLSALQHLSRSEAADLTSALTPSDAARVLDTVSRPGPPASETPCLLAVADAWRALGRPAGPPEAVASLQLFLEASRTAPGLAGPALASAGRVLVRLTRSLPATDRSDPHALPWSASIAYDPELQAFVGRLDRAQRAEVAARLRLASGPRPEPGGPPADAAAPSVRYTPFGAAFLLLPMIESLPLDAAPLPEFQGTPSVSLLTLLLLAACCGGERAWGVVHDPLLRDLLGIHPETSAQLVAAWSQRVPGRVPRQWLHEIGHLEQPEGGAAGPPYVLARVAHPGGAVAVLIDGERGAWRLARGYRARRPGPLLAALAPLLAEPGTTVLADTRLVAPLAGTFAHLSVSPLGGPELAAISPVFATGPAVATEPAAPRLAGVLTRLEQLPADLAHLLLPSELVPSRRLALDLAVVAQGVLRSFSRRLPGFAMSGLPYLYRNFLDVTATLEEDPDRHVVRIGRPPLDLVLSPTGLTRQRYRLRDHPNRPFALFPEG